MSARGCRRASWTEHPFRIGSCLRSSTLLLIRFGRELKAVADAAWDAYSNSRKSPLTKKAGRGFADPEYELAVDWLAARDAIRQAEADHNRGPARILLVNGSSRTEHTCPGEISKTWRLVEIAMEAIETGFAEAEIDVLDLQEEVRQAAIVLVEAVQAKRNGKYIEAGARSKNRVPNKSASPTKIV